MKNYVKNPRGLGRTPTYLFFFTRHRPLPYIARVIIAFWLVFSARRPLPFESPESRSQGTLRKDIKQSSTFGLAKQLSAGASQIYSIFITCKIARLATWDRTARRKFSFFFLMLEITNAATVPCTPWCLHN